MSDILKEFGKAVKKARKDKKLSQEKLAEISGIHRTYIGSIERGEQNISLKNIEHVANSLEINISDLFLLIEEERKRNGANIEQLESTLLQIITSGLAIARNFGGFSSIPKMIKSLADDPVWSMFGLEDESFVIDKVIGNYVTSVFRKFGDIYQHLVESVLSNCLNIPLPRLSYKINVVINDRPQSRSIDVIINLNDIGNPQNKTAVQLAGQNLIKKLPEPKPELEDFTAIGFEIRCCYQIGDSKRIQADETMGKALSDSKIMPVMMIFCNNSLPNPVSRLRKSWFVIEGKDSYQFLSDLSGFNLYDFLINHRQLLREEGHKIIEMTQKYKQKLF